MSTCTTTLSLSVTQLMQVTTDVTEDMCNFLLLSAAVVGVELRILGLDEGFGASADLTHDMRTNVKLVAARKFAATQPRSDLLMLVDAFDTVWQRPANYVWETYSSWGRPPIVFSAEVTCFPPQFCATHPPPPVNVPARYINTGGLIGRAGRLGEFWRDMEGRETVVNDQGTIAESFCGGNPHNLTLDYFSQIFFSHFNAADALRPTVHEGRQMFRVSDGEVDFVPAVVHFNGLYPGDGKRRLLQGFRSGLWWANDTGAQLQAQRQPRFWMGYESKQRSWDDICGGIVDA